MDSGSSPNDFMQMSCIRYDVPGLGARLAAADLRDFAFGKASNRTDRAFALSQRIPLSCVMKLMVSLTALALCEDGRLSLDADVAEVLPELGARPSGLAVRHLLSSTEGYVEPTDPRARWFWTWDDFDSFFPTRMQAYTPGEVWSYNHTGYALLARALERITGCTMEVLLRDIVWDPLGLNPRLFGQGPGDNAYEIALHVRSPRSGRFEPIRPPAGTGLLRYSISDMAMSLEELSVLAQALTGLDAYCPAHLRSAASNLIAERIALPAFIGGAAAEVMPRAFGLGIADYGTCFGINGSYVGSTTALRFDPASGYALAVGLNAWLPALRDRIVQAMHPAGVTASLSTHGRTDAEMKQPVEAYLGRYQGLMLGTATAVFERRGDDYACMVMRPGAEPVEARLSTVGDQGVRFCSGSKDATLAFHVKDDEPILMVGTSAFKKVAGL